MNSTKGTKTSKTRPAENEKISLQMDAIVKRLRKKGISAISSMNTAQQAQTAVWAQDVFNQYGSVLEKFPSRIKNRSELPFSKQDIKIAIKILLPIWFARGSENMVGLLKDRYIRLSAFQEIAEEDLDIVTGEVNEAQQKLESNHISPSSTAHEYMEIILTEQKVLLDEINSYINDLQMPKSDS
jgi:hypothetical protein